MIIGENRVVERRGVLTARGTANSSGDPNEQPHRVVNRSLFVAKSCMAHSNFFCRTCTAQVCSRDGRDLKALIGSSGIGPKRLSMGIGTQVRGRDDRRSRLANRRDARLYRLIRWGRLSVRPRVECEGSRVKHQQPLALQLAMVFGEIRFRVDGRPHRLDRFLLGSFPSNGSAAISPS